jgi:16S rRNA (uracil1498-N3)-methyltransferase
MMWEGARQHGLRGILPAPQQPPQRVVIATGPEGGFAEDEVQAARTAGFAVVGLGPRILRTETAALVTLSILGFQLGDLG